MSRGRGGQGSAGMGEAWERGAGFGRDGGVVGEGGRVRPGWGSRGRGGQGSAGMGESWERGAGFGRDGGKEVSRGRGGQGWGEGGGRVRLGRR